MSLKPYDRLASHYHWLERLVFGGMLHRCRTVLLPSIAASRRVLFLGDGDGRLLRAFLDLQNGAGPIDVVDQSPAMNALSAGRLTAEERQRVHYHHADARDFKMAANTYDAVVTPFFLDGFSPADMRMLVGRLQDALTSEGRWLYIDFDLPPFGWRRWRAQIWLFILYRAFSLTTGLKVRSLANVPGEAKAQGFVVEQEQRFSAGLLLAQVFRRGSGQSGC